MKISELEPGVNVYYDYSLFHVGDIITVKYHSHGNIICKEPHGNRLIKFDDETGLQHGNFYEKCHPRIHILTDEILASIRREKILSQLRNVQFNKLSTIRLEKILSIVKSGDCDVKIK